MDFRFIRLTFYFIEYGVVGVVLCNGEEDEFTDKKGGSVS